MKVYCFSIFFATVFMRGAVGEEDPLCLVEILSTVNPIRFFTNPDFVCQDIKHNFERVALETKKCTRHDIDLSKLLSLHVDFCSPDSDFSREFYKNRDCFLNKFANSTSCYDHWMNEFESSKHMCNSVIPDTLTCLNRHVGELCGESGLKAYQRMTDAQEPLLAGICLGLNGAAARSGFPWLMFVVAVITAKWHQN